MFRFFKKKSTPPESSVEDQSPTLASQEVEHSSDQPPAGVIVPETQPPVTPVPQDGPAASAQEAVIPPQTPFRRSAFAAALGGAGAVGVAGALEPIQPIAQLEKVELAEAVEILEPVIPESSEEKKASWLARLKGGLAKTGQSIGSLFIGVRVDEALFEELETALIMADAGVEATEQLLKALRQRVKRERIEDAEGVRQALREVLTDHLKVLEKPFDVGRVKPLVVMITGVNGAGKTTSIGKLAYALQLSGARVLLAAGDTFRAAARQQLIEWGDRNNVDVIAQEGADPAAVAFDSVHAGRARGMDVVMVDTAGRLPTQLHLMDELKKIRRVIAKADPTAPHEVLLVVDGNSGQNVLAQIRAFDAAVGLTGLIVTKLDGTAKGGTLAAVAAGSQGVRPVPVYWVGVGEKIEDLQPFVAAEFAAAVVG
jgi:fused signal recognition particle receptor